MKRVLFMMVALLMSTNLYAQSNIERYNKYVEQSKELIKKGMYAAAYEKYNNAEFFATDEQLQQLKQLRKELDKRVDDSYSSGLSYLNRGLYSRAIDELKRVKDTSDQHQPLRSPLYIYLGRSYEGIRNFEDARRCYNLAVTHGERGAGSYLYNIEEREKVANRKARVRRRWRGFWESFEPDDETWGLGYNYSNLYNATLRTHHTVSFLSIINELGINCDKRVFDAPQYNLKAYWTIAPGFYCRYLSLNCGVGTTISRYYVESVFGESQRVMVDKKFKFHFVVQPSVTAFIPICDEDYYLTLNAGYMFVPKFKQFNDWTFGVGFQWNFW